MIKKPWISRALFLLSAVLAFYLVFWYFAYRDDCERWQYLTPFRGCLETRFMGKHVGFLTTFLETNGFFVRIPEPGEDYLVLYRPSMLDQRTVVIWYDAVSKNITQLEVR